MPVGGIYVPPQRIGFKTLSGVEMERVTSLTNAALDAFNLDGYSITGITKHSNITIRLDSESGPTLALRLRSGPTVDGRSEFEWLTAVRNLTTVRTVEPFAEDFGSSTRVIVDGDATPMECTLFLWADGLPLAACLTVDNYRELGSMSAKLHEFASTWKPPSDLKPLIWNRTLYYEGSSLVISDPCYAEYVSRSEAQTVEAVVRAADEELRSLAHVPDRMFLHGNIEMWNVLVTAPGRLRLLDFEDVMLGAPVLDVAITLYYGRERPDHAALSEAYENGYRSVRDWPVQSARQMDLLVAARAIMLLNHALQTEPEKKAVTERLLPIILAAAN